MNVWRKKLIISFLLPEHPLSIFVFGHLIPVVEIRLPDSDERVFSCRNISFSHSVVAADVPGVDAGVVGRLDSARSSRATLQKTVAVSAHVQLSPVGLLGGVAVSNTSIAQFEILVG